jgi:hypothetical protein
LEWDKSERPNSNHAHLRAALARPNQPSFDRLGERDAKRAKVDQEDFESQRINIWSQKRLKL